MTIFLLSLIVSATEPTSFQKALENWDNKNLQVCHLKRGTVYLTTQKHVDDCRTRGGRVAAATRDERARFNDPGTPVPGYNDLLHANEVRKPHQNPASTARNYDPLD